MRSSLLHMIAASALCIGSLAGYGIWYSAVSATSSSVANLQDQINTKTETINRIAAARATLVNIANDEAIVRGYFVPETSIVSFINSLEMRGVTQGSSVNILSVSTGGTTARPALVLSIAVKGTFSAIMRTLGSIEYAPYNISISALSITHDDKNGWNADIKLTVGSLPASRTATSTREISRAVSVAPYSQYAYF